MCTDCQGRQCAVCDLANRAVSSEQLRHTAAPRLVQTVLRTQPWSQNYIPSHTLYYSVNPLWAAQCFIKCDLLFVVMMHELASAAFRHHDYPIGLRHSQRVSMSAALVIGSPGVQSCIMTTNGIAH